MGFGFSELGGAKRRVLIEDRLVDLALGREESWVARLSDRRSVKVRCWMGDVVVTRSCTVWWDTLLGAWRAVRCSTWLAVPGSEAWEWEWEWEAMEDADRDCSWVMNVVGSRVREVVM